MTDWGDYTPGRWFWPYQNALAGNLGPDEDPDSASWTLITGVEYMHAPTPDDARLISKAYLIPRLEAALDALSVSFAGLAQRDGGTVEGFALHEAAVVLAELRSGL